MAVLASLALLGACASDFAIDDAVPHPAADGTYGGPRDTGQYPNLNIRPKAATRQLTDSEVAAKTSELHTAKSNADARPADTSGIDADAATLRQVGRKQPQQVLKEIEGQ